MFLPNGQNTKVKDVFSSIVITYDIQKFGELRVCNSLLNLSLHIEVVTLALRCVIPVVCVTNEREEKVVEQHN